MGNSIVRTLLVVRHAKALQGNYTLEDIDRPLTDRGYSDAYLMSGQLIKLKIQPDLIISSPAVRAISTAFVFARQLHYTENNLKIESRLYDASVHDIASVVEKIDDKIHTAMIFGHNPGFGNFAISLCKNGIDNFPTTGICIIDSTVKSWSELNHSNCKLRTLLSPDEFK